jgi:hypothetical protein
MRGLMIWVKSGSKSIVSEFYVLSLSDGLHHLRCQGPRAHLKFAPETLNPKP